MKNILLTLILSVSVGCTSTKPAAPKADKKYVPFSNEGNGKIVVYDHCSICSYGVYLPHGKYNKLTCTYCGLQKGSLEIAPKLANQR